MTSAARDLRNPCSVHDDPWLWAESSIQPGDDTYVGKWLLFVHCANAAICWDAVSGATVRGDLGIQTKVASEEACRNRSEHVICVYTKDWRDLTDVARVAETLIWLHVPQYSAHRTLYYKPDVLTLAGISGSFYEIRPPYGSLEARPILKEIARSERSMEVTFENRRWVATPEDARQALEALVHGRLVLDLTAPDETSRGVTE